MEIGQKEDIIKEISKEKKMSDIKISERLATPNEFNMLRKAVNWGQIEESVVKTGLDNTLYSVCAELNGEIIGMTRVIGDDATAYYIHDVIVLPEFQKQGIGSKMMTMAMNYIEKQASKNAFIGLMAAKGHEGFYEKFGLIKRPNENFGCGMFKFN